MAIPNHRYHDYIIRSVNLHIELNFAQTESLSANMNYQNAEFTTSGKSKWVDVDVLSAGAGKKSATLVQIDIYTRVVGKIAGTNDDIYGAECARLARVMHGAMHVDTIQIYDFSSPSNPTVIANKKLLVQNAAGMLREPEETLIWPIDDGINRHTLTYRVRHLEDAAGGQYYD